jgi:hypothetical protein
LDEKLLGDALDSPVGGPPIPQRQQIPQAQPVNQATMCCVRGPCQYYWRLLARYVDPSEDEIHVACHRTCTAGIDEMGLADQNIYDCDYWWPSQLAFVPQSMRVLVRHRLRDLWETVLRKRGWDFSWRKFSLELMESENDKPERRSWGGVGRRPQPDANTAKLPDGE